VAKLRQLAHHRRSEAAGPGNSLLRARTEGGV
jgi:hypothetical protein